MGTKFKVGDKVVLSTKSKFYAGSLLSNIQLSGVGEIYKIGTIGSHIISVEWIINNNRYFNSYSEDDLELYDSKNTKSEVEVKNNPKYDRTIYGKYNTGTCTVDVYDVLTAFNVTNPQLQHAVKKCLAVGQRGHKNTREDLVDISHSVQSALDAFDKMNKD